MKSNVVSVLRCPGCRGKFNCIPYKYIGQDQVIDGVLKCSHCKSTYSVFQGVPNLLQSNQLPEEFSRQYHEHLLRDAPNLASLSTERSADTFSFSYQWSKYQQSELTWELYLDERIDIFYSYFSLTSDQIDGYCLLDAGCGNGTLSARLAAEGFEVFALDYSDSVYRAYQYQLFNPQVTDQVFDRLHYLQGDVLHPPFEANQFDLVYADGVLHHTQDTRSSFIALAQLVKPGGRFFVWLYRKDTKPIITFKNRLVSSVRRLTRNLSIRQKMALCYFGATLLLLGVRLGYIFGYKKRRIIPIKLKAVNLFDVISPQFNHLHSPAEVTSWFREAGYTDIKDVSIPEYRLDEAGFAMIGTRL